MVDEIKGLSDSEVAKSRAEWGANVLAERKRPSFISKFVKNLGDPIIRVLIAAFFVTLLFSGEGGTFEALGIAVSVFISTFVSTLSEYGSEKAFRRMQSEASAQTCSVIRNSATVTVPVSEVVCGDYILLRAGDRIAADGVLVSGGITCDMSAINGESREKSKTIAPVNRVLGEPSDSYSLFRGSAVTSGRGVMRATAVGDETYFGRIAGELQSDSGDSPLREKLSALAKTISRFGYFCAVAVAISHLIYTLGFDPSFVISRRAVILELLHVLTLAVSVVVVAVPEGLPMMITVVLSSNMIRMQKQNIRVRKPVGIETAGNVDILFTDKTGTLTYGKAKPVCFVTGEMERCFSSAVFSEKRRFLLGMCALYSGESRAERDSSGKFAAVGGDSADRAILGEYLLGTKPPRGAKREAFLPFDSRIKMSAACVDITGFSEYSRLYGESVTLVKGAPEILLNYCQTYIDKNGVAQRLDREALRAELDSVSAKGIRALAVVLTKAKKEDVAYVASAVSEVSEGKTADTGRLFNGASLLCIIGMRDELRRDARASIASLKEAGIQTVMITGDSRLTATAVARESGILEGSADETVLESEQLRQMSDAEIVRVLPSLKVVARALPDDKSRLVRIAKGQGRVTAMTGDGLNDAPALKASDVGFAMGSGTEVAKEAGDIIVSNNDISSIRKAVLYGRTIFKSIRKFIVFQLIMNLGAVGISIIGPFMGMENPVTVVQMLWINLIMDTLAALAFAGEAPMERYMKEPPVRREESVLNGDMLTRIFVMGIVTVILCLFYCHSESYLALFGGREGAAFASGFFALFVFCGVFCSFVARSARANVFFGLLQNPLFITVMAAVFCAQVGMIYYGGSLFRCYPLTVAQLRSLILLASSTVPLGMLLETLMKRKK